MRFIQTYETDLNQSSIRFKKERKVFTEISNHKGVIRALNYLLTRDEEKNHIYLCETMIHTITIDTMETAEHSTVPTYSIEKNTFPVLQRFYYKDNITKWGNTGVDRT